MAYSPKELNILCDRPVIGDYYRRYRNAQENDTLPDFYRGQFLHFKTDYSDETPSEDVRIKIRDDINHAIDAGYPILPRTHQYKCQMGFLIEFGLTFEEAIASGVMTDQALIEEVATFRRNVRDGLVVGDHKNPAIIANLNTLLDRTITHLTPAEAAEQKPQPSSLHK